MSNIRNLIHGVYLWGGIAGLILFTSLGYYMYENPQYDCNSIDFKWWQNGTDVKEPSGKIIHLSSCKETMSGWFTYSEFVIITGICFPPGAIIAAYLSGDLEFKPLTKKPKTEKVE